MPSIDNKKKSQQNKLLYIFLTAFFVSLIVIVYLATAFTPEIDVDVNGGSNEQVSDIDHGDGSLKELQQEEILGKRSDEAESSSDIVNQLKKMKEEAINKQEQKNEELANEPAPETPKLNPANPSYNRAMPAKAAKVYVGRYTNFDDAIKVQDALVNNSLASAPFIKNMGTYYVIQIGSYSNQQTAQNIAENLIEHGYSARMVLE